MTIAFFITLVLYILYLLDDSVFLMSNMNKDCWYDGEDKVVILAPNIVFIIVSAIQIAACFNKAHYGQENGLFITSAALLISYLMFFPMVVGGYDWKFINRPQYILKICIIIAMCVWSITACIIIGHNRNDVINTELQEIVDNKSYYTYQCKVLTIDKKQDCSCDPFMNIDCIVDGKDITLKGDPYWHLYKSINEIPISILSEEYDKVFFVEDTVHRLQMKSTVKLNTNDNDIDYISIIFLSNNDYNALYSRYTTLDY